MIRFRNLWIIGGIVILAAALISGFVLVQPTAKDILVGSLETAKSIKNGHVVLAIEIDTLVQHTIGTVDFWEARSARLDPVEALKSRTGVGFFPRLV